MNRDQAKLKQELGRLRRQKSVLWLGILFFVAVLVWTAFAIFSSQKKVKVDSKLTELAKPLIPRLAAEVFGEIEQHRYLSEEELTSFPIYVYWADDDKGLEQLVNIMDSTESVDSIESEPKIELEASESASLSADLDTDLTTN